MSAWATLGLIKLLLDIIDDGPWAIVKGVMVACLPSHLSELVDAGELMFMLFDLDGNYQGTKVVKESQSRRFNDLKLRNREQLDLALAKYDFPQLAKKQLATMDKREFQNRSFPRFD